MKNSQCIGNNLAIIPSTLYLFPSSLPTGYTTQILQKLSISGLLPSLTSLTFIPKIMRISPAQQAPAFSMADINGRTIDLSSYGGRKVLLTFFRNASCPFCNLRVHRLAQQREKLEAGGLTIITVFHSSADEIRDYLEASHEGLTIIADPDFQLYRRYGVESSLPAMMRSMGQLRKMVDMMRHGFMKPAPMLRSLKEPPMAPADFLINGDQTIAHVHYGKNFGDHIPIDMVWSWLKEELQFSTS